jgi:small-conductance mechanosensitive channel
MKDWEIQLIETAVLVASILGMKLLMRQYVNKWWYKLEMDLKRKQISHKIVNLFLTLIVLVALAAIWNIEREQLLVFFTSVVTVIGIAFFAQWSHLSNITSSLIIFFNHPVKIGQRLRIHDKEFDIEGVMVDMSFFFVYIKSDEGNLFTIPNNVFLQKTIEAK